MIRKSIVHFRTALLTATIVLAPAVIYVSPAFDARPACVRATTWATEHSDDLPRTAAELAAFPDSVRRSIFSALPAETKAAVWKEQLLAFRASRRLTIDQHNLIDEGVLRLTPTLYSLVESPERNAAKNAFKSVAERARVLFPPEDARVFYQLSHSVRGEHTFASLRFRLTEELRHFGTGLANQSFRPECQCSIWTASYDCGGGNCNEAVLCWDTFGCGPGGDEFCRGLCGE